MIPEFNLLEAAQEAAGMTGRDEKETRETCRAFLDALANQLRRGKWVHLTGFGSFEPVYSHFSGSAALGIKPTDKWQIKFHPSEDLKDSIFDAIGDGVPDTDQPLTDDSDGGPV